jgi:hypothetical protein
MAKPEGAETCTACHGEGYFKPKPTTFNYLLEEKKPVYTLKKKETSWAKTLLGLVLTPISILLGGFVLAQLWNWFVPPVFASMPMLTTGQGVGLNCVLGMFKVGLATTIWTKDDDGQEHSYAFKLFATCLAYVIMFVGGYIVHLFLR